MSLTPARMHVKNLPVSHAQMIALLKSAYEQFGESKYMAADCAKWIEETYGIKLTNRQVGWCLRKLDVQTVGRHGNRLVYKLPAFL